ncbi:hypothetical protein BRADI_4g11731v3 [Brachypodium distachyon]|uniref:Uncharacterized protein n=1 Tax=Brachypodium distachyon TaxID=15368 RepID=A0A0Q3IMN3_BRADI|nr:hypothetical protein BRADI_4g11731v3 [Brachypodium distachyon]
MYVRTHSYGSMRQVYFAQHDMCCTVTSSGSSSASRSSPKYNIFSQLLINTLDSKGLHVSITLSNHLQVLDTPCSLCKVHHRVGNTKLQGAERSLVNISS